MDTFQSDVDKATNVVTDWVGDYADGSISFNLGIRKMMLGNDADGLDRIFASHVQREGTHKESTLSVDCEGRSVRATLIDNGTPFVCLTVGNSSQLRVFLSIDQADQLGIDYE